MTTRREFVVGSLAFSTVSLLPFRMGWPGMQKAMASELLADSPIRELRIGEHTSSEFSGDEIERTHKVLWNVEGYVKERGGWPTPSEQAKVVVIGGGVAGLSAAFALRDQNPIILEQDSAFGGNSKGEKYGQSGYSIGAAYLILPEADSNTGRLLKELKLEKQFRLESADETTVFIENRFAKGFWHAATDPQAKPDFERVYSKLKDLNEDLPEDPRLDRMSFVDWLKKEFGDVHPHLVEYFQLYCWSSFCASIDEISAYQMLGFIAAETGTLIACPGGNSLITAALHHRLVSELGRGRVRSQALAINVRNEGDGTVVTYVQPDGSLRAIHARKVVFAAPKFVAKHVISDLPKEQAQAMNAIHYRGYLVANVILDKPLKSPSYEMYCLENEIPPSPSPMKQSPRPFSDIVFGSWAQGDKTSTPVLTLYKAFAFDGDRQFLFNPATHDKYRNRMGQGLLPVLAALGVKASDVRGIRMTRWGHSMPIASRGLIADGIVQAASKPIGDRIFFANQDNWANPSFETALDAAVEAAQAIRKSL